MSSKDAIQGAWERGLLAPLDASDHARLARFFAEDPDSGAAWAADRRLAIRIAALARPDDTAVHVLAELRRRRTARARRWQISAAAGLLAATMVIATLTGHLRPAGTAEVPESPGIWHLGQPTARTLAEAGRLDTEDGKFELRWSDGSLAHLERGSVVEHSPDTAFSLVSGRVDLSVTPSEGRRRFAVVTPTARIEVLGTVFRVFVDPESTAVSVRHGVVKVTASDGSTSHLAAGEQGSTSATGGFKRDIVDWSMRPGQGGLRLLFGELAGDVLRSAPYPDPGTTPAIPLITLQAPAGEQLFLWHPGQRVRIYAYLEPGHSHLGVLVHDAAQQKNAEYTTAAETSGAWSTYELPLDRAKVLRNGRPLVEGTPLDALTITGGKADPAFRISEVQVIRSTP